MYPRFKSVGEYNSTIFQIRSQLELCEEEVTDAQMIEKTLITCHADNVLLQQQYQERRLTKYSELILFLLIAKQNNNFLMRNYDLRLTGFDPLPKINGTVFPEVSITPYNKQRYRHGSRHGYGGRGSSHSRGRWNNQSHGQLKINISCLQ